MIGFYDYTVIFTFLSVLSSLIGMTRAAQGDFRIAIILLGLAGFFDAFDGKIARSKKNRTEDEKLYGIQLDSLADIVSFGVYPAMIAYLLGMREIIDVIILCLYVVCGVIRLSYFNVLATNNCFKPKEGGTPYYGLPITYISIFMPLSFFLSFFIRKAAFMTVLRVLMLIIGILFVMKFKIKKPNNWQLATMMLIGTVVNIIILFL